MRPIGDFRMIVVGLVMFLSIMFRPKGLFGEVSAIELVRKRFGAAWRSSDTLGWR
jgi:branched-chain amino acid transport system permease protein